MLRFLAASSELAESVSEVVSDASEAVSEAASEAVPGSLGEAVSGLVENPNETWEAIKGMFSNVCRSILNALPRIGLAIVILLLGILFSKLALKMISKGLTKTKLDLTVTKFASQIAKIVLYVLLLTIVLSMLGIPSSSIITVIGTAGVAIGLALKDSLSNVAGGFLLMINKPFKIGDYIITNGVEGTVAQISILYTRLDSVTNQAVFVPNGLAVNATVINNNAYENRRLEMLFSISYDDDFKKAKKLIEDVLNKHTEILHEMPLYVVMKEHASSSIVILVRAWCKAEKYWDVYFDLLEKVREAFDANDIHIPYGQLDVHLDR